MHRIPPPPKIAEPAAVQQEDGPAWLADAACRGAPTDLFFHGAEAEAVAVCRSCPVAGDCLDHALTERIAWGVWGGLTGDDRRAVAKLRGIVAPREPPPARVLCACGRWARSQRTMCSACQQRHYRASKR